MPADEYSAWLRHLLRWPTMDMVGPRLLGGLCALTANAHFQLSEPARTEDFATWLETPGEREKRIAEKQEAHLVMQTQLVGDIYMSKRGENA